MTLSVIFYPYHFVLAVLSIPFCPMPFCPYTILSIPFCPYHFVRYHFVLEPRLLCGCPSVCVFARPFDSLHTSLSHCLDKGLHYINSHHVCLSIHSHFQYNVKTLDTLCVCMHKKAFVCI